jgi:hypothetical protein
MALPQRLLDHEAPNASGRTNDQRSHPLFDHDTSMLLGAATHAGFTLQ